MISLVLFISTFSARREQGPRFFEELEYFLRPMADLPIRQAASAKSEGCSARTPMQRRFQAFIIAIDIDRSASSFSENCTRASSYASSGA